MVKGKALPVPGKAAAKSGGSNPADENAKRIQAFVDDIDKKYGTGSAFYGKKHIKADVISTGSIALDKATGVGGFPKGRIIEIFGPESSGKTTIALKYLATAQAQGGLCAFIDMEQALDPIWAAKIGVDMDKLVFSQPESGEQAMDIVLSCIQSGLFTSIVVDSAAALTPRHEIEGDIGDSHVGLQARLIAQSLRKINMPLRQFNTTLVFTNQIRDKIGMTGYGPTTDTPGGRALKFYCSLRLDVRRIETLKTGEESTGTRVKVEVKKNKVAPPFTKAEITIRFATGISVVDEILDGAIDLGIVQKRGAFFKRGEETIGQGREKALDWLKNHPLDTFGMHNKLLESFGFSPLEVAPDYGGKQTEEEVHSDDDMLDMPVDLGQEPIFDEDEFNEDELD